MLDIQTHMPDIFMKIMLWIMGGTFASVVAAIGLTWKASAKITKIDESLKEHENDLINHKVDDAKEFSIVAKALDEQKQAFEKMQDKYDKTNIMLERFISAEKVRVATNDDRFKRIESEIVSLRKL